MPEEFSECACSGYETHNLLKEDKTRITTKFRFTISYHHQYQYLGFLSYHIICISTSLLLTSSLALFYFRHFLSSKQAQPSPRFNITHTSSFSFPFPFLVVVLSFSTYVVYKIVVVFRIKSIMSCLCLVKPASLPEFDDFVIHNAYKRVCGVRWQPVLGYYFGVKIGEPANGDIIYVYPLPLEFLPVSLQYIVCILGIILVHDFYTSHVQLVDVSVVLYNTCRTSKWSTSIGSIQPYK